MVLENNQVTLKLTKYILLKEIETQAEIEWIFSLKLEDLAVFEIVVIVSNLSVVCLGIFFLCLLLLGGLLFFLWVFLERYLLSLQKKLLAQCQCTWKKANQK